MNGPLPALSDAQIAAYAQREGFGGEGLVTIAATILAESGGDPDNVGDESLANATWGPSIGLAQIRSLWADRGTGRARDPDRLTDPAFNLRSAFSISSGGTNFRPWTMFTSGRYREYLARAWAAVASPFKGKLPSGIEGLQGTSVAAGGGIGDRLVEPLTSGLARIALVGALLAGGVALVAAGGWRAVAPVRERAEAKAAEVLPLVGGPAGAAATAATAAKGAS